MIKNIIFDVDNTIVESTEKYAIYYKEALSKMGYDENRYLDIYNAINEYEKKFTEEQNIYSKEDFVMFINARMKENYSVQVVDEINEVISKFWTNVLIDRDVIEYLSKKYNLYIYSNWFYDCIVNRLTNIDFIKYFKKVYSSDVYGSKPFRSSFENVIKDIGDLPEECIMIGDSLRTDMKGANNIGMQSILYDCDNSIQNFENIKISDFKEIMKIL